MPPSYYDIAAMENPFKMKLDMNGIPVGAQAKPQTAKAHSPKPAADVFLECIQLAIENGHLPTALSYLDDLIEHCEEQGTWPASVITQYKMRAEELRFQIEGQKASAKLKKVLASAPPKQWTQKDLGNKVGIDVQKGKAATFWFSEYDASGEPKAAASLEAEIAAIQDHFAKKAGVIGYGNYSEFTKDPVEPAVVPAPMPQRCEWFAHGEWITMESNGKVIRTVEELLKVMKDTLGEISVECFYAAPGVVRYRATRGFGFLYSKSTDETVYRFVDDESAVYAEAPKAVAVSTAPTHTKDPFERQFS